MPKPSLRIVKRARNVPVLGVCEACNAQFAANPGSQSAEAQAAIQQRFNQHKCKSQDASPPAKD